MSKHVTKRLERDRDARGRFIPVKPQIVPTVMPTRWQRTQRALARALAMIFVPIAVIAVYGALTFVCAFTVLIYVGPFLGW